MTTVEWLKLPLETRDRLKSIYSLRVNKPVEVRNNVIVSDGISADQLIDINLEDYERRPDARIGGTDDELGGTSAPDAGSGEQHGRASKPKRGRPKKVANA